MRTRAKYSSSKHLNSPLKQGATGDLIAHRWPTGEVYDEAPVGVFGSVLTIGDEIVHLLWNTIFQDLCTCSVRKIIGMYDGIKNTHITHQAALEVTILSFPNEPAVLETMGLNEDHDFGGGMTL